MTAQHIQPPYGELWKVARVDVNAEPVTEEQWVELFAWLDKLGVDHQNCAPNLVITQRPDKTLLLHVTQFARANGEKYIDHAANRVHTEPLVVQVTEYPAWLVQASHFQDQTKKGDAR